MTVEIVIQAKKGGLIYGLLESAAVKGDEGLATYYEQIPDNKFAAEEYTAAGLLMGILLNGGRLMPGSQEGSYKIITNKLPPKQMAKFSEMGLGTDSCDCGLLLSERYVAHKIVVFQPPAPRV